MPDQTSPTITIQIADMIKSGSLGKAIDALSNLLYTYPRLMSRERLETVMSDYQLMVDYWKRGFEDVQRPQLYEQLRRRLFTLNTDIAVQQWVSGEPILSQLHTSTRKNRADWTTASLCSDLEGFVTELALLELEPEHTRAEKEAELYTSHQEFSNQIFNYILTTRSWSDNVSASFEHILTSPTIDPIDQQQLVSAVTLSAMKVFDFNKFRLLVNVYLKASDEKVRQRALVGWALTLDSGVADVYPEMKTMLCDLLADEKVCEELAELQMQLVYCINAEDDRQTIEREIMPDLLKNGNYRVTPHGIEEIDDDPMEDILHPDAAEQRMEKMEESMQRMVDMQKAGSDIYFGGFKQMKRFPFFSSISNWFVPFYPQHPAIRHSWTQGRGRKFLRQLMSVGAFCSSDKYSFVLAFNFVSKQLPEDLLQMMERGEASMVGAELDDSEQNSPAFLRRMYLQDLYRFFKVYPQRSLFSNPFADFRFLFFAQPLFFGTPLEKQAAGIATFLTKRRKYAEAAQVLQNCSESVYDYQFYMVSATVSTKTALQLNMELSGHKSLTAALYAKALECRPDSQAALRGYARSVYSGHDYDAALDAYDKLLLLQPDESAYLLGKAVCLTSLTRYAEAESILFQLSYNHPDDQNIERVLAWTLVGNGKFAQAERIYVRLTEQEEVSPEDLLNYGYCLWLSRRVGQAVECFNRYAALTPSFDAITEFRQHEAQLLASHGITSVEVQLMADQIYAAANI